MPVANQGHRLVVLKAVERNQDSVMSSSLLATSPTVGFSSIPSLLLRLREVTQMTGTAKTTMHPSRSITQKVFRQGWQGNGTQSRVDF